MFFIISSIDELRLLPHFAIVNKADINIGMHIHIYISF